jgi:hypothetical protein
MAEWSQTSAQRLQLTPCLSTQIFTVERVATSLGFGCSQALESAAPSAGAEGKKADNNARRDTGMLRHELKPVPPKKVSEETRTDARIPGDAVVLEHV